MTSPIGTYQPIVPQSVNVHIYTAPTCPPQIQQPNVAYMTVPTYPSNFYTNNYSNTVVKSDTKEITKTEVKEVPANTEPPTQPTKKTVRLTNEYIKKLENYLDSQDVEKRILAAKDILDRVQEDSSRKDNPALNALTNKMLKDPYQPIRFLALAILEDRNITGNQETTQILHQLETGRYSLNGNKDQDAIKASNVLLKMTRKVQE